MCIIQKTHEKYIDEIKEKNPNIEVLEKYKDGRTKILHKCLVCGYQWYVKPQSILKGNGCPKCGIKRRASLCRRTQEQYAKEIKDLDLQIEVLGTYINSQTSIPHKCLVCDYVWNAIPNNILRGEGCPKCGAMRTGQSKKKSQKQYENDVKDKRENIEVIGEYLGFGVPIRHRCLVCGYEWEAKPTNILNNGGACPKCSKKKLRKSQEQYIFEVGEINSKVKVLGEYINTKTPILHKCLICDYEWEVSPASILMGNGCPRCSESRGEKNICSWLDNHNIEYQRQYRFEDCKDKRSLPFDFYLPALNICIEFDGKQHSKPIEFFGGEENFDLLQRHDNIKTQYCEDNNISLIRIQNIEDIDSELSKFLLSA